MLFEVNRNAVNRVLRKYRDIRFASSLLPPDTDDVVCPVAVVLVNARAIEEATCATESIPAEDGVFDRPRRIVFAAIRD